MRDRAGVGILAGVFILAGSVFGFGMSVIALGDDSPFLGVRVLTAVLLGLVFGAAAVVLLALSGRHHGGRLAVAERTLAVKRGQLPPGADASWLPGMRARLQNARQLPWAYPVLAVLMALFGIGRLGHPGDLATVYWLALAVVFLVLGAVRLRDAARDREVLTRFIAELETRAADATN